MKTILPAARARVQRFIDFLAVPDGFSTGIGVLVLDSESEETNNCLRGLLSDETRVKLCSLADFLSGKEEELSRPALLVLEKQDFLSPALLTKVDGIVRVSDVEAAA